MHHEPPTPRPVTLQLSNRQSTDLDVLVDARDLSACLQWKWYLVKGAYPTVRTRLPDGHVMSLRQFVVLRETAQRRDALDMLELVLQEARDGRTSRLREALRRIGPVVMRDGQCLNCQRLNLYERGTGGAAVQARELEQPVAPVDEDVATLELLDNGDLGDLGMDIFK